MKKALYVLIIATLVLTSLPAVDLTGLDIVRKAHDVPEPATSSVTASLVIHSKKGNEKTRTVIMKSKDYGDVTKEVVVFTAPRDVAGVGYLMFNYPEADDGSKRDSENWLYMPALKKAKRIAASGTEAEGNFMGTDFTYEDMGERAISKDNYTLLGTEMVDGVTCYKVRCESKARTESDPDRIIYLGTEDYILRRCEFFDRHGQLHRVLSCGTISVIDGYYTTSYMKMENVQSGTWSDITLSDVVYDTAAIDDSIFTVSALEQRRVR